MQLRLKLKRERMDRDVLSTEYIDTSLPQYVVHLANIFFHPAVVVLWGLARVTARGPVCATLVQGLTCRTSASGMRSTIVVAKYLRPSYWTTSNLLET